GPGAQSGDGLWSLVLFTAIFLLLVDLMHRHKFWTARYPPGPVPLPGLGNLLQVDFENMPYSVYKVREMASSVFLLQLRQRYGDVFSLQMAWKPVINGLKAVREVLVTCGEDTADHPPMPVYGFLGYGPKGKGKEL
ncbi:hypothetical protein U0070_019201, partial [Myodes glareolus]